MRRIHRNGYDLRLPTVKKIWWSFECHSILCAHWITDRLKWHAQMITSCSPPKSTQLKDRKRVEFQELYVYVRRYTIRHTMKPHNDFVFQMNWRAENHSRREVDYFTQGFHAIQREPHSRVETGELRAAFVSRDSRECSTYSTPMTSWRFAILLRTS